ncbi:MAG TPA: GatB/YqeY domain-containing protein [Saprospiraceae bacterium]|nr:GatB/YqeY domain-containing protein [Saprospiraceae bacterium]HRP40756.1 GatB/YqeY domain-containing protein [Saprospiraceae bacterium]
MSLETKIADDIKEAMKSKNQAAMRTLRAVKSAILLHKTSGAATDLTEQDEIKLIQKLIKQRQDSLDIYTKQNREDLAVTEREEIHILGLYLPKQLSPEELKSAIAAIIADTGATSVRDMGKVMGVANQQLAGTADGKSISAMVKELLG